MLTLFLDLKQLFFDVPKLLLDDISSCNITNGWIITSYLDIQKCSLVYLNLTKLSIDQKLLKFDTQVPNLFILIFNSNKIFFDS